MFCKKLVKRVQNSCKYIYARIRFKLSILNGPLRVGIFQKSLKLCPPEGKTCFLRKSCKNFAKNISARIGLQLSIKTAPPRVGIFQKSLKLFTPGIL